jgi:glycosyltransferase XagB
VVAVADLDAARDAEVEMESALGPVRFALAPRAAIEAAVLALRRTTLARLAEHRVPASESVRGMSLRLRSVTLGLLGLAGLAATLAPVATLGLLTVWAILSMVAVSGLRAAATLVQLYQVHVKGRRFTSVQRALPDAALPVVSLLVPLFREREIAGRLVQRLARLDYPQDRLDILLVVEADDRTTRDTLAAVTLPPTMRAIVVPPGTIRTKPRAMNYALDFCRGSIVGVYDAEDAPAPDQLAPRRPPLPRLPARGGLPAGRARLLQCPHQLAVALLHHRLRHLVPHRPAGHRAAGPRHPARRHDAVLPPRGAGPAGGLGRAQRDRGCRPRAAARPPRLPLRTDRHRDRGRGELPRRPLDPAAVALAQGLCAHLDLAHAAAAAPVARPRPLAVHRRADPVPRHAVVFLFAPFVWSFWLLPFGLPTRSSLWCPGGFSWRSAARSCSRNSSTSLAGSLAVSGGKHRWLIPWVPTMHFYHPLGALASWKALVEIVVRPFYWDKTAHGRYDPKTDP